MTRLHSSHIQLLLDTHIPCISYSIYAWTFTFLKHIITLSSFGFPLYVNSIQSSVVIMCIGRWYHLWISPQNNKGYSAMYLLHKRITEPARIGTTALRLQESEDFPNSRSLTFSFSSTRIRVFLQSPYHSEPSARDPVSQSHQCSPHTSSSKAQPVAWSYVGSRTMKASEIQTQSTICTGLLNEYPSVLL